MIIELIQSIRKKTPEERKFYAAICAGTFTAVIFVVTLMSGNFLPVFSKDKKMANEIGSELSPFKTLFGFGRSSFDRSEEEEPEAVPPLDVGGMAATPGEVLEEMKATLKTLENQAKEELGSSTNENAGMTDEDTGEMPPELQEMFGIEEEGSMEETPSEAQQTSYDVLQ